jgi:hypothetical protein
MNRAASIFAFITAMLEDMRAIAVEGQTHRISADEASPLVSHLRNAAVRLKQQIDEADALLIR